MFRTELNVEPSEWKITLDDQVFSMGSCFAAHIGGLLKVNKFEVLTNPFGTIFNPVSLFRLMDICVNQSELPEWSFLENQGVHRNYLFHSDISGNNNEELNELIVEKIHLTRQFLINAKILILTLGTSVYYRLNDNNEIVANCHKVPSHQFTKEMLTTEEIVSGFQQAYQIIKQINPNSKFILTVSPVRHLKDSLELNSVSKAILRTACEELQINLVDVDYFPSYELMMDDLRDYRFYKEDMLHPNEQAVQYIWNKFIGAFLDPKASDFITEWDKIRKSINHRPFYPGSKEHQLFIQKTIKSIEKLNRPNLQEEIELLKKQLHA